MRPERVEFWTGGRSSLVTLLRQGGRYLATSVMGLALDVGVATALVTTPGLALLPAATLGFAAGVAFNYSVHTLWTFRETARRPSPRHALGFLAVTGVTLSVRLIALFVLERAVPLDRVHPTFLLLVATALSFGVNFILLSLTVFSAHAVERPVLGEAGDMEGASVRGSETLH